MEGRDDKGNKESNFSKPDIQKFALWYIGWSSLDKRTTLPMLPWLVAEIRKKSEKNESGRETCSVQAREVQLVLTPPFIRCVPANNVANSSVFIFEHKAQFISRFIHNSNDLTYFAYLIRSQPDNPESEMACHVFRAYDPNQVPEVISSIRAVSKSALKEDSKPKRDTEEAFYNSQKFEVLYCVLTVLKNHSDFFPNTLVYSISPEPTFYSSKEADLINVSRSDSSLMCVLVFQVGRFEVNLISPDSKTVVLEKRFKDISSCSQGINKTDHFGFIFRDPGETGPGQYVCYVFQCASESLVDEVMLTLKQAFSTAAALQSAKTQVKLCEACPMHDLHKLCERIEGTPLSTGSITVMKPVSDQEENELVILHLRQLCGTKQKSHLHIGEAQLVLFPHLYYRPAYRFNLSVNQQAHLIIWICCLSDHCDVMDLLPLSPRSFDPSLDPLASLLTTSGDTFTGKRPKRTAVHYRALWKTAIHQQILLLRMEKENQRLEASRDELHIRKMKLDYQEVGTCIKDVLAFWDRKLSVPGRAKVVPLDKEEVHNAISKGVPKGRRGEVWLLFSQQHRLRHRLPPGRHAPDTPYQDLLKQLTAQQHSILVDLGRTFPTHQYFSAQLGAGQLSLYNLLKAYSLLDTEVGYCQGISFVAGILLLHMSEDQAFDMLKFLMYDLGFRRQYRPDMTSLQIQMYQLSRLLHDYHRELYNHLEEHEICPSLYAAPWFLTLFASQFPLGFVARIFDILFAQGSEVIFKVALCLLSSHEGEIVECDSFETIVDYLKTTIPNLTHTQMEETISKVLDMDISKQLHAYEVEYHVLQDETVDAVLQSNDSDRLDKLEKTNNQLKKQNMDLLEKLQAARQKIQSLEATVENFLSRESKMKHMIRSLEQERQSYQKTIERMRSCLPPDALADVEMTHMVKPAQGPNGKAKPTAKKP
uniref:TBC1 domain family member 4 n=1 Tax=Oncorhynchus mykiss TaxID=8022 RepID=A0A8C7SRA4_ONCMY